MVAEARDKVFGNDFFILHLQKNLMLINELTNEVELNQWEKEKVNLEAQLVKVGQAGRVLKQYALTQKSLISEIVKDLKKLMPTKLKIKNLSPEEESVEINKNLCLRCEEPVINGIPYEDGFYCDSCAGYLEARAEDIVDAEIEQELLNN